MADPTEAERAAAAKAAEDARREAERRKIDDATRRGR
jgi:hypothetical protein